MTHPIPSIPKFTFRAISLITLAFAAAIPQAQGASLAEATSCLQKIRPNGISDGALKSLSKKLPNFFGRVRNKSGMVLADFSQHNNKERMYLIDFDRCKVVYKSRVTHGGRWHIFYDAQGRKLPNSTGRVTYDTFSPGDPLPTDFLLTCTHPKGGRTHMTRPGFSKTGGCHTTGLTGWPVLWQQGGRACHGIRMLPLEPGKQGSMDGVVMHEHLRMKFDTVGQGCLGTMPGYVSKMMREGESSGFDIRNETLIYTYAPQCGE